MCLFCANTSSDSSMGILNPPDLCCRYMCFLYFKCYLLSDLILLISDLRRDEVCENSEGSLLAMSEMMLFSPIS